MLTKVLVNKLKKVIGNMVSGYWHAFVEGIYILDVVLIRYC